MALTMPFDLQLCFCRNGACGQMNLLRRWTAL